MLSFAFHHWHSLLYLQPHYLFHFLVQCSTFDRRCSPPYMVIIFLFFWSISFTSYLVQSIMPALYRIAGTIHVFIACDTCFAFNFDLNVALNLLKYSFLMFSLISFWQISLSPKHQSTYTLLPQSDQFLHHFATSFLFFIAETPHLFKSNFKLMSFLTISTVLTRLSV